MCQELVELSLDKIRCDDIRQSRDAGALHALTRSLKVAGQLHPIRVRPDGDQYAIVDGHRRFAGTKALGRSSIRAIVVDRPLAEDEALQQALISNTQRESLTPVDLARSIARLMELTGWNASETASHLGFSVSSVTKSLAILNLSPEIRERIASKEIPATAAYELARIGDPGRQAELARQLASGQLTRDDLSRASKNRRRVAGKPRPSPIGRAQLKLAAGTTLTVASKRLDFDCFIDACEGALVKAKKARGQNLTFETFLRVVRDQAPGEG